MSELSELLEDGGRGLVTLALREMDYWDYLLTEHWRQVRAATLKRANYRCRLCDELSPLDAHHMTYANLGDEAPGDTIALCRPCHANWHATWVQRCRAEGEQQFGADAQ